MIYEVARAPYKNKHTRLDTKRSSDRKRQGGESVSHSVPKKRRDGKCKTSYMYHKTIYNPDAPLCVIHSADNSYKEFRLLR